MAMGGTGHSHGAGVIEVAKPGSKTRIINIASGKGGVGKSSVSVNLACVLAARGHSVGVLDTDVYGFSVPQMLGVTEPPGVVEHHVLIPPVRYGVACISMGLFVPDADPLLWRGPMLHKALNQFLTDVRWDEPDFLIVDTPPGTGDVALSMAQLLPMAETYVVTTPQPSAQRVAQRSAALAREHRLPVMGIIENMTSDDELFGAGGGQALADSIGTSLATQVPLSKALRVGADNGEPVVVSEPNSDVAAAFSKLAVYIETHRSPRITRSELTVA